MKLSRVPLHAIKIELIDEDDDDETYLEPIIYRNPIVYSHSHSLLRICLWNSQAASEAQAALNPLILNGIRSSPRTRQNNYERGRESVEKLARDLHSQARLDDNATKSAFVKSAPDSRLIHVHSHVHWDITDPLAHSIDFTDVGTDASASPGASTNADAIATANIPTEILSTSTELPPQKNQTKNQKEGKLTAQEIFALPLSKGSHVSLIACSSGLTQGNRRDEVFGLVPAFLRSGASSTISTLWKIPDRAGAGFTGVFYRDLLLLSEEERRSSSSSILSKGEAGAAGVGKFLNLARIFRKAVMERAQAEAHDDGDGDGDDLDHHSEKKDGKERKKEKEKGRVYDHWTSFVMHGFWMFYLPPPPLSVIA